MSPLLFEVLGWIAGILFVLTIIFSVMFVFVCVARNRLDEEAENMKYINEQEIEKK